MVTKPPLSRNATLRRVLDRISSRKPAPGFLCARCGHHWAARLHAYRKVRGARPVSCPRCKRRNWWIEAGILMPKRATVIRSAADLRAQAVEAFPHLARLKRRKAI